MRFITGRRQIDKIRITNLRRETNLAPLYDKVKSKSLKLFGHIKRSQSGLSKLCLEGSVPGYRKRGRPKRRWRENILTWAKCNSWSEINTYAQYRNLGKSISHVNSQSTAGGNSAT